MNRSIIVAAVLLLAAGCEQENQTLPFEVGASATKTVGNAGGTVSTPAGAAVEFPEGSLAGSVQVSVTTTDVPAAVRRVGAPASESFLIEPVGTILAEPASLQLKFDSSVDPSRAWLTSVVSSVNGDVQTYGSSRVDLSTGLVAADLDRLGVMTAVIPPASSTFQVQVEQLNSVEGSNERVTAAVQAIEVECGDAEDPCTGLTVAATSNLLNQVEDAAVVYPVITGGFAVGSSVTGSITAEASLRIKLQSGQTAESVEVNAELLPTASTAVIETAGEIRFTNVLRRVAGSTESESEVVEEVTTLVVPKNGSGGSISISRSFEIRTTGGVVEPASVTLTFPVTVN